LPSKWRARKTRLLIVNQTGETAARGADIMDQLPLVFTVLFMLLGPIKLIPAFAAATQGTDRPFKRAVAVRGAIIASLLCAFVALAGARMLANYRISIDALRIGGGLVLLLSALQATFSRVQSERENAGSTNATQLAASPVAVPGIVPPAGVAALLIFTLLAPSFPGMQGALALCLVVVMGLDFLVMYFSDLVARTPGLGLVLTVLGSVLVFVQICLAIQMMLVGLHQVSS